MSLQKIAFEKRNPSNLITYVAEVYMNQSANNIGV